MRAVISDVWTVIRPALTWAAVLAVVVGLATAAGLGPPDLVELVKSLLGF